MYIFRMRGSMCARSVKMKFFLQMNKVLKWRH